MKVKDEGGVPLDPTLLEALAGPEEGSYIIANCKQELIMNLSLIVAYTTARM